MGVMRERRGEERRARRRRGGRWDKREQRWGRGEGGGGQ